MPGEDNEDDRGLEQQLVVRRRFNEACDYGLTRVEARLFAESQVDIGELRRLKASGCPPRLAASILI